MSDTPRTDEQANGGNSMGVLMGNGLRYALVQSDFARQLERELSAAAMELDAMRTANAGLMEKVKRFTEVLADPAAVWANMLRGTIAMPPHIPELEGKLHDAAVRMEQLERSEAALLERVKRLEEAGDAHREWVPVSFQNEWEKAKGKP